MQLSKNSDIINTNEITRASIGYDKSEIIKEVMADISGNILDTDLGDDAVNSVMEFFDSAIAEKKRVYE